MRSIDEAIAAARAVEARGLLQTLDYLGESVGSLAAADAATREYLRIIDAVVAAGIGRNLSLKLTQLGLDVDRASAVDNLRKIFDRAEGFFVRIDMESSAYTDVTLDIFETLWHHGYRSMGVVLQSELHRSEQDARRIIGARRAHPARQGGLSRAEVDRASEKGGRRRRVRAAHEAPAVARGTIRPSPRTIRR